MKKNQWIRAAVVAGLLAWPGVETWRYFRTVERMEAALQLQDRVSLKLAQARIAHRQQLRQTHTPAPGLPSAVGQAAASNL